MKRERPKSKAEPNLGSETIVIFVFEISKLNDVPFFLIKLPIIYFNLSRFQQLRIIKREDTDFLF